MSIFTPSEHKRNTHLVTVLDKLADLAHLDIDIIGVRSRVELDLLGLLAALVLSSLLLLDAFLSGNLPK